MKKVYKFFSKFFRNENDKAVNIITNELNIVIEQLTIHRKYRCYQNITEDEKIVNLLMSILRKIDRNVYNSYLKKLNK